MTSKHASILNDALGTGDTIDFVKAIGDLIRAQGMTEVSEKTGLNRSALYTSFGGDMMPNIYQDTGRAPIRDRRKANRPILIHSGMPDRPQKITFAEMRNMGVRGL